MYQSKRRLDDKKTSPPRTISRFAPGAPPPPVWVPAYEKEESTPRPLNAQEFQDDLDKLGKQLGVKKDGGVESAAPKRRSAQIDGSTSKKDQPKVRRTNKVGAAKPKPAKPSRSQSKAASASAPRGTGSTGGGSSSSQQQPQARIPHITSLRDPFPREDINWAGR